MPGGATVPEGRPDPGTGQFAGHSRAELAREIEFRRSPVSSSVSEGALNATINPLRVDGVVPLGADRLRARHRLPPLQATPCVTVSCRSRPGSWDAAGAEALATTSLKDLTVFLGAVERFEAEGSRIGQARKQALEVLGRVSGLAYTDTKEFPPLRDCQRKAVELARAIEGSQQSNLLPDAFTIAEGNHPYNALLALAEPESGLSDEQWADALEAVETHFGKPLSVAAARAKIVVGTSSQAPPR